MEVVSIIWSPVGGVRVSECPNALCRGMRDASCGVLACDNTEWRYLHTSHATAHHYNMRGIRIVLLLHKEGEKT